MTAATGWRLADRLKTMPSVLAGPILRHTSDTTVTVWLALQQATTVSLTVYDNDAAAGAPVAATAEPAPTVAVGTNLHLVAVTAKVTPPRPRLSEGVTYYYDLRLADGRRLKDPGVLSNDADEAERLQTVVFGSDKLPSFALPPADLGRLRILHGSCRKPHADEYDGLAAVHHLIESSYWASNDTDPWALTRPHLLMLTGDQIYADDVADCMLAMCTDFGDTLLGWSGEQLPGLDTMTSAAFPPGTRAQVVTEVGGLTGSLVDLAELAKSQLMGLGEYLAMYLLVWSPVLWPATLPRTPSLHDAAERERVELMRGTLPQVRRALANVITYMSWDDHEVTDDWNLNREWCRRVWGEEGMTDGRPLGRRIVTNGMLAHAVCQAWGSMPDQFTGDTPGARLLAALPQWDGDPAHQSVLDRLAALLGVPTGKLPAGGVDRLPRAADSLRYHYRLTWTGRPFEILVTDSRTTRSFDPQPMEPPAVMSDEAIAEQLPAVADPPYLTIAVVPGPVLGVPWIEEKQEERTPEMIWGHDAEAWGLRQRTFHRLLGQLAHRPRVVLLSGDVHYGFTIHLSAWNRQPYGTSTPLATPLRSEIAQFTASALKNETNSYLDLTTDKLQGVGWNALPGFAWVPHNPADEVGWAEPLRYWTEWRPAGSTTPQPYFQKNPSRLDVSVPHEFPHYYVPEHWRHRIRYGTGTRSDKQPPVTPLTRPAPDSDKAAFTSWYGGLTTASAYARRARSGTQLVGNNNLGEIRFAPDSSPSRPALAARHILWWQMTAAGQPAYSTTFDVTLDPADASAVPPSYVERPQ
ncbi:metallophosphoesterase family protein [Micromonospora siamensis]|uniref:PhoD-like phosphatase n=1 Tax=Micromonospora siamensis TaxID=299152 RepID=A0A1C5IPG3_9ACTN|nr:hypothetical protein [Micromonospora siamensis]SCG60240.1 hypothetical protein GA0074704_3664 [Micromonospora siamensis]